MKKNIQAVEVSGREKSCKVKSPVRNSTKGNFLKRGNRVRGIHVKSSEPKKNKRIFITDRSSIVFRLNKYMSDNNLSRKELAEQLNVHVGTICSWFNMACSGMSRKSLESISKLLNVPEESLINGSLEDTDVSDNLLNMVESLACDYENTVKSLYEQIRKGRAGESVDYNKIYHNLSLISLSTKDLMSIIKKLAGNIPEEISNPAGNELNLVVRKEGENSKEELRALLKKISGNYKVREAFIKPYQP